MLKENCSLAVIVPLRAYLLLEALAELAKWSVEGGADALSISKALVDLIGADSETGVPLSLYMDSNGGLRGEGGGKEDSEN